MNRHEQLTAYALGELTGDEARDVEQLIERDAEAKAHVDEMKALADDLAGALRDEDAPTLTDAQRQRIAAGPKKGTGVFSEGEKGTGVIFSFRAARWLGAGVLAAAALGLAFTWPYMTQRADTGSPGEVAMDVPEAEPGRSGDDSSLSPEEQRKRQEIVNSRLERVRQLQLNQRYEEASEVIDEILYLDPDNRAAHALGEVVEQNRRLAQANAQGDTKEKGLANLRAEAQSAMVPPSTAASPSAGDGGGFGGGGGGGQRTVGSIFADPGAPPQEETAQRTRSAGLRSKSGVMQYPNDWPQPSRDGRAAQSPEVDDVNALNQRGQRGADWNREEYARLTDNPFITPEGLNALSTFSIDVDTASYANVRRYINAGQLPPPGAVRIEELINYFDYSYEAPPEEAAHPFNVDLNVTSAPWQAKHRLVRIGLKGYAMDMDNRPATNLVFLLDVSGSMADRNKLPLVKESIRMLVEELNGDDRVAIVVYAGASGLALPSTYVHEKDKILAALDQLSAGGSTHGSAGIKLAYKTAQEHFIEGGVNRVILCTDGDFNVGVTSDDALVKLIEQKRDSDIFLSVLGFGTGNWQDAKMEQLSNHGNGTFAYIDTQREARKVLIEQAAGTLVTIAKDVKVQVEFNPRKVSAYRLIGYSNRLLEAQDFNDDTKDAGEIGAGHTVTALYEVVPAGVEVETPDIDKLKYQQTDGEGDEARAAGGGRANEDAASDDADASSMSEELLTVKLRYKRPDGDTSSKIEFPLVDDGGTIDSADADVRFAAAVAQFGMLLRESPYKGEASWAQVLDLAESGRGDDPHGYRAEFIELVRKAQGIVQQ